LITSSTLRRAPAALLRDTAARRTAGDDGDADPARTLALTLLRELDVSVLRRALPARTARAVTRLFAAAQPRARAKLGTLAALVERGRIGVRGLPAGRAPHARGPRDVEEAAADLRVRLRAARSGAARPHGPARQEAAVRGAFSRGRVGRDWCATTVIARSAFDIPAAQAMLVAHADDFGLASCISCVGRAGRGSRLAALDRPTRGQLKLDALPRRHRAASARRPGQPVCLLRTAREPASTPRRACRCLSTPAHGCHVAEPRDTRRARASERSGGARTGCAALSDRRARRRGSRGLREAALAARGRSWRATLRPVCGRTGAAEPSIERRRDRGVVGGDAG
jgi:hypothetical protein